MRYQDSSVYIRAGRNAYHIGSTLFGQVTLGDNPYREEPARKLWTKGFTDARNKLAPKPVFQKGINDKGTRKDGPPSRGNSKVLHKRVEVRQSGSAAPAQSNGGHRITGNGQKAPQRKQESVSWSSWDNHVASDKR